MAVGIDLGSNTIKIVELEKTGNLWVLAGSGVVNYPREPIESLNDEKSLAALSQVIKKLHKEAKIASKNVAISLPENQVFTRTIRFPLLSESEIASAIKWEAEQYVPIPISEAVIQHKIIEKNEKSSPPEVIVLLVAAPLNLVQKYLHLFELAGLNVDFVETELLSLVRALAPIDQTVLLLDFGNSSTDIAIAKNANLVFSRSIPVAGQALTRTLAKSLQVEEVQAEEYKKTYGLSKGMLEGKVGQVLIPVLNTITDEIKKAIHFYQTEEKGGAPKTIFISGGSSGLVELTPYLTKQLGLEVIVANPFNGVKVDSEATKALVNFAPLYCIAVGLAKREG